MLLLAWRYRRIAILAMVIAFLVGYSRIYLGLHYPLDVLGGWGLGGGLAFGFYRGLRWIDGRARPA